MADDRRTIPQVLDRIADQFPEHDALVTPDRQLTFAQLRDEVRTPGIGWWRAWPLRMPAPFLSP
jgi:hypothetical protein